MDKEELIRILNENFLRELEATLIYVQNSFLMVECDSSRVTEAISVDEMRHMWWLADLITKRGGKTTMGPEKLDFGGDYLEDQLKRQIELETEGIERYTQQIATVDDEEVVGVLKHILDEEKRHRKEFRILLENMNRSKRPRLSEKYR